MLPTGLVNSGLRNGREQTISRRVFQVQEEERRRIARELHDDIGQSLTLLKLLLDKALSTPQSSSRSSSLKEAKTIIVDLVRRLRELSLDLWPSMLDDLGLLPTLLWHFGRVTAETQIRVKFQHSGLERAFPLEVCIAAYRIIEEAFRDAARYGEAKEVKVYAWTDDYALYLEVEDPGMDIAAAASDTLAGGFSLVREYAESLGARAVLDSSPEFGARITVAITLSD